MDEVERPKVALVYCEDYQPQNVQSAVEKGLMLLGGIRCFAEQGEKILLKPNILSGAHPTKLISPHPEVFRAIAKAFKLSGAELSFGDSPGFGNPVSNAARAGFIQVAEEEGVEWANFTDACEVQFPQGRVMKKFSIAEGVYQNDGLISIAKLKTHALTRITGAIKNQFGCIPGVRKAEFHSILPTAALFAQMLVDLNRLLNPRLFIMDAIVAMEGNGPRNGTSKPMHVLLFSTDAVALDATACRLINLDVHLVETIIYGSEFGLGSYSDIDYVGDKLETFLTPDFVVNRSPQKTTTNTSFLSTNIMRRFTAPRPTIKPASCTKCGRCIEVCPAQPKALSWRNGSKMEPPIYDYTRCIRCYCCQELCPSEAIYVSTPLLGRIIRA